MRYLCSQLAQLSVGGDITSVNLEEIWPLGAILESESPTALASAELRCNGAFVAGRIRSAEEHAFGWRIVMDFSPLTPWSLALFEPEHLLATESP